MVGDDVAHGIKLITREASEKICRYAFEYAKANGRKKVTAIHKANIMKFTDGLFLECFRNVGKDYPEIEKQEVIIDNMCMQLVLRPETLMYWLLLIYMEILFLIYVQVQQVDQDLLLVEILEMNTVFMKLFMVVLLILQEKELPIQVHCFLAFALMLEALGQNDQAKQAT